MEFLFWAFICIAWAALIFFIASWWIVSWWGTGVSVLICLIAFAPSLIAVIGGIIATTAKNKKK